MTREGEDKFEITSVLSAEKALEVLNKGGDRCIIKNGDTASQCNELAHAIQVVSAIF